MASGGNRNNNTRGLPRVEKDKLTLEDEPLGSGGFGKVFRACHADWGNVAVKKLETCAEVKKRFAKPLIREAENLYSLRHPNIVLFMGIVMDGDFNAIIMEYMAYGSLDDLLRENDVPWPIIVDFVSEIVLGMNFLHTRQSAIIHRDLKAPNVLIGDGLKAKIADFGLSEWRSYSRSHTKRTPCMAGTPAYIAPESWNDINAEATLMFDVYAFGILLWEIIHKKQPFEGVPDSQIKVCVCEGQRPSINRLPEDVPQVLVSLMQKSWAAKPKDRPRFQDIKDILEKDSTRDCVNMDSLKAELMSQISKEENNQVNGVGNETEGVNLDEDLSNRVEVMQIENVQRPHTDGRERFGNIAVPPQKPNNTVPNINDNEETQPKVAQVQQRSIIAQTPTDGRNGPQATVSADALPQTELQCVNPQGIQSFTSTEGLLPRRDMPLSLPPPNTRVENTDPSQSLRNYGNVSTTGQSTSLSTVGSPRSLGHTGPLSFAGINSNRNAVPEEDGPSDGELEHDAVPSLTSPQSPNMEFPLQADPRLGDSQPAAHRTPQGPTSLPPSYSAANTYSIPTPVNVAIGSAQPVIVHEQEGRGKTTIYQTEGVNKGFVQIGDGNYMVVNPVNPPPVLPQPRAKPRPPKGKRPTESQKMITDANIQCVSDELGNYWKALGYKLGFTPGDLDALKHDYFMDGLKEIIRQMLWMWKRQHGKRATQAALARSLWDIDKFTLSLGIS